MDNNAIYDMYVVDDNSQWLDPYYASASDTTPSEPNTSSSQSAIDASNQMAQAVANANYGATLPVMPVNQQSVTATPNKVVSILQGVINGVANALNPGSTATPPYMNGGIYTPSSNMAAQTAADLAAKKAKQNNILIVVIVLLVVGVLAFFAFKKK